MVAVFLKGEIDSHRWGSAVLSRLSQFNLTEETIRDPSIEDAAQNASRAALLGDYRGWPDKMLFNGWPRNVEWSLVTLDRDDLAHVHYGAMQEWANFSGGTLLVRDGARRIVNGDTDFPGIPVAHMIAIADRMRTGAIYEPVIAVATPDGPRIVLVEGWARTTAFAMVEERQELGAICTTVPLPVIETWNWFPSHLRH